MPANDAAAGPSAAMKKLVAKSEVSMNITWSSSGFGGSKGMARFQAGMNKFYGTNFKIKFTPGGNFSAVLRNLEREYNAKRKSHTDIILAGTGQAEFLVRKKLLRPTDWAGLLPGISPALIKRMTPPDRSILTIVSNVPGIVFNTSIISRADAQKTLRALLNPKWKGKIAFTPYASQFGALGEHPDWGKQATLDFAHKLAVQLGGLAGCSSHDRITSGEFPIFAIMCHDGPIMQMKAKGAPMDSILPHDLMTISHWYMGVPKNSANPVMATLFTAFLATPEGQKVVFKNQGADYHHFKGSRTAPRLRVAEKESGKSLIDFDIHRVMAIKYPKLQRQVAKIFREAKRKKK